MKKIKIGKISGAQGLRGEVRIFHDSGDEDSLKRLNSLFVSTGENASDIKSDAFAIKGLRMQKRTPILKLEGIDDRNAAEALVGSDIYALVDEARPDEEGAWLVSDLIGMAVMPADTAFAAQARQREPSPLSWRVRDIIPNPAHDILEIETEKGHRLLPFVDAFVLEVDTDAGVIVIDPPDGWLD